MLNNLLSSFHALMHDKKISSNSSQTSSKAYPLLRTFPVSDFTVEKTGNTANQVTRAIAMHTCETQRPGVIDREARALTMKVMHYIKDCGNQRYSSLSKYLKNLPEHQEDGSLTPDRIKTKSDMWLLCVAQVTSCQINILELSDKNEYIEVGVFSGFNAYMPGEDHRDTAPKTIYLMRSGSRDKPCYDLMTPHF